MGHSKPLSEEFRQALVKDETEKPFTNDFGSLKQLKSNTEHLGRALKTLSGEDENLFHHSCTEDLAMKAHEHSTHTLEECSKEQAKILVQVRSTIRNFFSRKRSQAKDRTLMQNQLVLLEDSRERIQAMDRTLVQNKLVHSEESHNSGLGGNDSGDVLFGLNGSVESNGRFRLIGFHSTEESATEEIEIVYMHQDGPAFSAMPDELAKEESAEHPEASRRNQIANKNNASVDTDSESTNASYPEKVIQVNLKYDIEATEEVSQEAIDNREEDTGRNPEEVKKNDVHLDSETREPEPTENDQAPTDHLSSHSCGSESLGRKGSLRNEDPSLTPTCVSKSTSQHQDKEEEALLPAADAKHTDAEEIPHRLSALSEVRTHHRRVLPRGTK
eukprot:scaffold804_cov165-Amphora_coffeaeformis.AAC.9